MDEMINRYIPQYDGALFSYHAEPGRVLMTAEASTIGFRGLTERNRIYDDACDVGIAIRSHRTGKVIRFFCSGEDDAGEGEVAGWRFSPIPEDARKVSTPVEILIIND